MPRPFIPWPDPRLKAIAAPVERVDDEIRAIWDEMLEAMYAMPGVGLAAPQLGIGLRLAVVDCGMERKAVRLANPEIVWTAPVRHTHVEGSPNLPGVFESVERPAGVRVRYLDETGTEGEREFNGMWATSVQHQIDHLDGLMFFDRLSPLRRRRLLEKHRKTQRRKKGG